MNYDYDICVVGSGAGGAPITYELSKAGKSVVVLEKGPWFKTEDFTKDELTCCRRSVYTPNLRDERHVIEDRNNNNEWIGKSTYDTGRDFWNGNMVGGSSNLMSGYFHRLKPEDFRLLSEFGTIEGANIVDWPISYDDLEPYYTKVEKIVGVSGKVVDHPFLEPRSTKEFPYSKTAEHPIAQRIDKACNNLGFNSIPTPRAILSQNAMGRNACSYTNYCGSYGCSTDAKGSARAALLNPALKTGNCEIIPNAIVYKLVSDSTGKVISAKYYDNSGNSKSIKSSWEKFNIFRGRIGQRRYFV
jgi:choline dehydrogenase-like flavoprotein